MGRLARLVMLKIAAQEGRVVDGAPVGSPGQHRVVAPRTASTHTTAVRKPTTAPVSVPKPRAAAPVTPRTAVVRAPVRQAVQPVVTAQRAPYPKPNNNPGNMRYYGVGWYGENPKGLTKGQFTQFDDPQNGLRAAMRNMMTLAKRSGKFTIGNVIRAYSPKTENNTAQHIKNISAISGLKADQVLNSNNTTEMTKLLRGLVTAESGKGTADWFTPAEYVKAVRRARMSL